MMEYKVLHISDIHFGSDKTILNRSDPSIEDYFDNLLRNFMSCIANFSKVDAVIVNGDIVNSGEVGEFKLAKAFFERVNEILSNPTWFFVPGNHDKWLGAGGASDLSQIFTNNMNGIGSVMRELETEPMNKPFQAYCDFINRMQSNAHSDSEFTLGLDRTERLNELFGVYDDDGFPFYVIYLNSSWLCDKKDVELPLKLGWPIVNNLVQRVKRLQKKKPKPVLGIMHHGFNWLAWDENYTESTEQYSTTNLLIEVCDFILIGHEHGSIIRPYFYTKGAGESRNDKCSIIPVGSLYNLDLRAEVKGRMNSFNMLSFSLEQRMLNVEVFRYTDSIFTKIEKECFSINCSNLGLGQSEINSVTPTKDEPTLIRNLHDFLDTWFDDDQLEFKSRTKKFSIGSSNIEYLKLTNKVLLEVEFSDLRDFLSAVFSDQDTLLELLNLDGEMTDYLFIIVSRKDDSEEIERITTDFKNKSFDKPYYRNVCFKFL